MSSPIRFRRWWTTTPPPRRCSSRPLIREGGQWGLDEVTELGALSRQRPEPSAGASSPTATSPILHTHDRYGHRVDEIEYDPAYHELMRVAIAHGLHAAPWADDRLGAPGARGEDVESGLPSPVTSARSR